ncbi:MAG: peptide ABC transporter ATPase [Candidatus Bathyarchaeota archaeon B26-2]|nr:MAG: peptide ABC transporter ATPase [Candidatus Bathyarchaeota archaeon B26-2]
MKNNSDALIEAQNLSKIFEVRTGLFKKGFIKAVNDVSLAIREKRNFTIVGESGCGKSTLGRLMLGLLKPSSGRILFEGKDIWKMSRKEFREFRRNAQIIHQDPYSTLNPVRTIHQSLAPPLLHHRIARSKEEAIEIEKKLLLKVGLNPPEDFLNRYPSRMSGGQMQRVAIARAISIYPKFIMADEVTSMLDASLRLGIIDLMLDLQREFKTSYLFITHDLAIARYFTLKGGGEIGVMYLGRIVEVGGGEEIVQHPIHPYTQALVSSTPIPDPELTRKRGIPPLKSLELPKPTEIPPGCAFHTRCPYSEKICEEKVPEMRILGSRKVACHFAERFL